MRTLVSLMGPISVAAAYYHCQHCRCGHKPWEETLHLKAMTLTSAAEQITALAGVLGSFGQGAQWKAATRWGRPRNGLGRKMRQGGVAPM
jgi:hypothetical protein